MKRRPAPGPNWKQRAKAAQAHKTRLLKGIAEMYQVVGGLADMADVFEDEQVQKALDWLANPTSHDSNVLPFNPRRTA